LTEISRKNDRRTASALRVSASLAVAERGREAGVYEVLKSVLSMYA
jgi:hypothetical protein